VKIEVFKDPAAVARAAASFIAHAAREAIRERGRCVIAASGGTGPWEMFRVLAAEQVPWPEIDIAQADERVAPAGHSDRNWTHLRESLIDRVAHSPSRVHPMPVEEANLETAAERYTAELAAIAGSPPVLDVVHLGIGEDGHTASLVPGDPVLGISDRDVAVTGVYQGRRRMTLTFPAINRARYLVWLVSGEEKASALEQLLAGSPSVPAGRVNRERAIVFADCAATR
jgi:6-phosphogluconolactonase